MKLLKNVALVALAIVLTLTLGGCGSSDDLSSLVTGTIDSDVRGIVSDKYLEDSGWSKPELDVERKEFRDSLAEGLNIVYGVTGESNFTTVSQISPYYERLLQKFEYEVVESVENEGETVVTIKYKPFLLGLELDKVALPFYENLPPQGNMSDTAYANRYDNTLFPELLTSIDEFIENPILGEEEIIDISVYVDDEGWELSDNYYDDFLWSIIDLNL